MSARDCGTCRECCIVLEVEAMQKPADTPCRHLCAKGCGIYHRRPDACSGFTCAWREGQLGRRDAPNQTHMVIWVTRMLSPGGSKMEVIQCDMLQGAKRHKKTMRWLIGASHTMPVTIIQAGKCELFSKGVSIVKWQSGDFVNLKHDPSGFVKSGYIVPRSEALENADEEQAWEALNVTPEIIERDPIHRREQLAFLEGKQ